MSDQEKVTRLEIVSSRPSPTLKTASVSEAKKAAQMILSCYPDFGKAPPEYIVNLIDVLATFRSETLVKLCNLREGIVARCSYLPSVAEIVSLGNSFEDLDLMEKERVKREIEDESRRRVQEEKRQEIIAAKAEKLAKAKQKYPTAFIDANGDLRYVQNAERLSEEQIVEAQRRNGVMAR